MRLRHMSDEMTDLAAIAADVAQPESHPAGGDIHYIVDDLAKWKSLGNFLVPYIDASNPWKEVERQRPIFDDAVAKATDWFQKNGALLPIRFPDSAIEVHLHPNTHQVVFFFKRGIGGLGKKECGVPYMLPNDQVGWMKATGRWPKETSH